MPDHTGSVARATRCEFFLVLAVFGTLAEMVFTHSGVWHYANPTWVGISLWFPLAFGTAGLTGQRLAHTAAKAWEKI
ncbi:MAG: hypothetical protein JXA14_02835 [Anaerolineae bacterium]|nr:hypothetical protein [Anaerolineae bacterium]